MPLMEYWILLVLGFIICPAMEWLAYTLIKSNSLFWGICGWIIAAVSSFFLFGALLVWGSFLLSGLMCHLEEKRKIKWIYLVLIALKVRMNGLAMGIVDGTIWIYRVKNGTAEIFNNASRAVLWMTTNDIIVPKRLGGVCVTSIGNYAFFNCGEMTNVAIPGSVIHVGKKAFWHCSKLTTVKVLGTESDLDRLKNLLHGPLRIESGRIVREMEG